jgi:hypothetical protein
MEKEQNGGQGSVRAARRATQPRAEPEDILRANGWHHTSLKVKLAGLEGAPEREDAPRATVSMYWRFIIKVHAKANMSYEGWKACACMILMRVSSSTFLSPM